MEEESKECWWELIYILTDELNSQNIAYCYDASTSLFVNGIDFEMNDIDILVQWDCFRKSFGYFEKYGAYMIENTQINEFKFKINSYIIHVKSEKSISNIEQMKGKLKIERDGYILWSRDPRIYREKISLDHPLADLIDVFFEKTQKKN
jgi:hypothetical protein